MTQQSQLDPKRSVGILVADASRARFFVVEHHPRAGGTQSSRLQECGSLSQEDRRLPVAERLSGNRPGLRSGAAGSSTHTVDAYENGREEEYDRRFATEVAAFALEKYAEHNIDDAIVAASPRMIGMLRGRDIKPKGNFVELSKDLTGIDAPTLRKYLVERELLSP